MKVFRKNSIVEIVNTLAGKNDLRTCELETIKEAINSTRILYFNE